MVIVVLGEVPAVSSAKEEAGIPQGWTISGAEDLLRSLKGVVSVRVVAKPGGKIEEIHMLTTADVNPKQTVRNVESALLAHYDLEIDHRCISVAESNEFASPRPLQVEAAKVEATVDALLSPERAAAPEAATGEPRILFHGHRIESTRSHEIRMVVTLEWNDETYEGEAAGPDIPRGRLETVASATLRAIENAMRAEEDGEARVAPVLALDGVKIVDAFDRKYVLVAVHALTGRDSTSLAGSAAVVDSPDRAVILATLQAADRWVRGRMN